MTATTGVAETGTDTETTRVRIGVIGGGSRNWGHKLLQDLALTTEMAGEVALYDVNYEAAETNARLGRKILEEDEAVGDWTYSAERDLDAALDGADVVIISVQDPIEDTFKHDLDIPKEYGVYQSVGDTVGPGGTFRAIRAVPTFREFAATIREQCPEAWVINYTNPMTVCTRALYEEFPDIKAFGVCHEVYGAQWHLAWLAEKHLDLDEMPDRTDIDINVTGINHFTWITEARWNGHDIMECVEAELAERKPLPDYEPGDLDDESRWINNRSVAYDLTDRFGAFAAAGDRHLAEFVPWYLDDEPDVQRWGFRLTPSETRLQRWPDGDELREKELSGEKDIDLEPSGEETVEQIQALLGAGEELTTNLNVPNQGQVPNLPEGAVVETNVVMGDGSLRPVTAGPLPRPIRNIVATHVDNQETVIEAGFAGDLDLAFQAFLNDPLVTVDMEDARSMFADLVEAEREYLQAYDIEGSTVVDDAA